MASSQPSVVVVPQSSYAGLDRRIAAHLIDVLIAGAVMLAAAFTMRWLRTVGVWTAPSEEADPVTLWHGMAVPAKFAVIVVFIVSMGPIYLGLFQASAWQASIGKRLLTIYVTDRAGRRLGLGRSLARSFAKDIFSSFYLGFVSLITIAVSTKKQALHDYAAKTLVVNGRPSMGGSLELWRIVAAFGIQFLLFVVTFTVLFGTIR
jgi:uncharacterized RDD family membrane protein YckC